MKDFRVMFINTETGKRNHRDFATLKGALRFLDKLGRDDCIVSQYSYSTLYFEPISYDIVCDMSLRQLCF